MTFISVSSVLHHLLFSLHRRGSTRVSLGWHWTEPIRIDWSATCSPVCQPWIICNDIQSISRGLAACIHCGKWTAQSKEALEKLVITGGRALTQNAVPLTRVTTSPTSLNGRPDYWIPRELRASVCLPLPLLIPSLLLFNRAMLHSEGHVILVCRQTLMTPPAILCSPHQGAWATHHCPALHGNESLET